MSNPHKDWLIQEQTALGKDISNSFMAYNLPKNCMVLNSWLARKVMDCGKGVGIP